MQLATCAVISLTIHRRVEPWPPRRTHLRTRRAAKRYDFPFHHESAPQWKTCE
jgi:hypothetical protein